MICINCFHAKTQVKNSRPHKKQPSTWRRRHCLNCHTTFTTYERPSLEDKSIISPSGTSSPFNIGKLIISISQSFQHNPHSAAFDSFYLAQTVETKLLLHKGELSVDDVLAITHETLSQFDPAAGIQYAAQHGLRVSSRRPGRPFSATAYVSQPDRPSTSR